MLSSLLAAFKLPDLRKRILFVISMFALYVFTLHIPVPGIDTKAMERLVQGTNILGIIDVFVGGGLRKFSIVAMGIMPYITASIIMQLLTMAFPNLQALAKEGGELGRKKISQYTRWMTVGLCLFQATMLNLTLLRASGAIPKEIDTLWTYVRIAITLTAGTCFLMWLGELITDKGVGNGVSLLIFCSIMIRLPYELAATAKGLTTGATTLFQAGVLSTIFLGTIAIIVAVQLGERKIPIQYAKQVVGSRMVSRPATFLPVKVNTAGVIPIIFAMCILQVPQMFLQYWKPKSDLGLIIADYLQDIFVPGYSHLAAFIYGVLVIIFTYFYTAVIYDPKEVADNLSKYAGFIPGVRPGKPTVEYLDRVISRITFAGAIFLAFVALLQYYVPDLTGIKTFSLIGGTSLLIVVGVGLETLKDIETHLVMRRYEGFIK